MNKKVIIILLSIIFFIIFFLQANIFRKFTISGIMPNLFVIYILFISLFTNATTGISFGVIGGLIIDFIYSKTIAITAIMLCIIAYIGAYFDRNFSKENKITIIAIVAFTTIIYETGYYLLNSVILNFKIEWIYFLKILILEIIYNILITILLYPLIQKAGYSIERNFKQNNVFTRYF